MTIIIKNKETLIYNDFIFKCCVGKNGITKNKKEGDKKTPAGLYNLENLYYRDDRVKKPITSLKCIPIHKKMGWCDDPRSKNYNKLVRLPFKFRSEKLYRKDNVYDIILVLNYNINPIRKAKGSAIFIHISKKNFSPTKGCVAIKKIEIKKLVEKIDKKTIVKII